MKRLPLDRIAMVVLLALTGFVAGCATASSPRRASSSAARS